MRTADYEYLYSIEEDFWWFVAMRQIADAIIAPDARGRSLTMLDAGCGTGYNIRHFEAEGHTVFAFDISEDALSGVRRRGFHKVCRASAVAIPYRSETFDFAYSFDVIDELSLNDADKAFAEIRRVLKPGGLFLVRLPALEWMRSSHDDDIETVHRYTRPELREALQRAGFELRFTSYANMFLFPIVFVSRSLKRVGIGRGTDTKPLPQGLRWIDPIFRRLLAAERGFLGARRSLPIGLSVIGYAQKTK